MALFTIHSFSKVLGRAVTVLALIPQKPAPENGFKTLWLLHGSSDNESIWLRRTSIERYADSRGIAVIMAGVHHSGYSDMTYGLPYYTFMTKELPAVMRDTFPLSSAREDNYIAGLSMGGEGAFKLGLANPDMYSAIGCFSAGAFNHPWVENPSPEDGHWIFLRHAGKKLDGIPEDCFGNAKRILAEGKPIPRIYHAIGEWDFLLEAANETKAFFEGLPGNPFGYVFEKHPGEHTWSFWDEHIQRFFLFLDEKPEKTE